MIKIMCKMDGVDVDFSEKTLDCLFDFIGDDDEFDNDNPNYEKLFNKDGNLIGGEEVTYGLWTCKLVETKNAQECEKELTDLKHDIKRYFELDNNKFHKSVDVNEYMKLYIKLSKAGNAE